MNPFELLAWVVLAGILIQVAVGLIAVLILFGGALGDSWIAGSWKHGFRGLWWSLRRRDR